MTLLPPHSDARSALAAAARERILVLDGAGWHTKPGLATPDGIELVYLPPYTPELQPAEHLWPLVDEPVVNRYFETIQQLDKVVDQRCLTLAKAPQLITHHTNFHWWPKPTKGN